MLEGLEVTVLPFKEALELDETGRIDSGFFSKNQIRVRKLAELWETLGDSCETIVCGPFGSTILDTNYVEDGVPMIRPFNLRNMRTDAGDVVHLSKEFVSTQGLKLFNRGDLMFARVGDVGCSTLLQEQATISPNIIAASLKAGTLNPFFVAVFFNTEYGKLQMQGAMKVVAQPTISTDLIRKLKVPPLTSTFQSVIEQSCTKSESLLSLANNVQVQAEQTLLQALGMENWEPPDPLTYTRRASEAFAAGRLDAEHFRPKFAAAIVQMKAQGYPLERLENIIEPVLNGWDCREFVDEGTPYIRVGDIKGGQIKTETAERVSITILDVSKDISLRVGDVLFTRKGSFGNAAPVREGEQGAIISSEIMLVRLKSGWKAKILPEFLVMYFNSLAGALQSEQWAHGVAFYSITQDDLCRFIIPVPPIKTQEQIKAHLEHSQQSRKEAQALLGKAKRAVEVAIEESEIAALNYLKGI